MAVEEVGTARWYASLLTRLLEIQRSPPRILCVASCRSAGGVGSIFGSLIGALVMISLTSGMNLMGVDANLQYVVRGLVLVAAVIFDVTTRRSGR